MDYKGPASPRAGERNGKESIPIKQFECSEDGCPWPTASHRKKWPPSELPLIMAITVHKWS